MYGKVIHNIIQLRFYDAMLLPIFYKNVPSMIVKHLTRTYLSFFMCIIMCKNTTTKK